MYLTTFFGFLTVVSAVLGFIGIGFGAMSVFRIIFFIILALTIISFIFEKYNGPKKYYD